MNQLARKRVSTPANASDSEKEFALGAFTVISILTALAWVLTG